MENTIIKPENPKIQKFKSAVILDFDQTLFDTPAVRKEVARVLNSYGVSEDLYLKTYADIFKTTTYTHEELASRLFPDKFSLQVEVVHKLKEFKKSYAKYIYPDTIWFLKQLKTRGAYLCISTFGHPQYQTEKIEYSGIMQFFDDVVVTKTRSKTEKMDKWCQEYPRVAFADDHEPAVAEVNEKFPQIQTFLIDRHGRNKKSKLPRYQDLKKVYNQLLN